MLYVVFSEMLALDRPAAVVFVSFLDGQVREMPLLRVYCIIITCYNVR